MACIRLLQQQENHPIYQRTTANGDFDAVHEVELYGISENMYALIHKGKYGAINIAYSTTIGYYVVKLSP